MGEFVAEAHAHTIVHATGKLAAGRVDVVTAGAADGGEHAALDELVAERGDHRHRRAAEMRARERVEGDEVELGGLAAQQPRELTRVRTLVVHAIEHHILEGDAASVLLVDVVPAGLEQLGDRVLAVDGHELVAQRVIRRMQGHREGAVGLLRELVDLRHETGGRERDAAARDVEAEIVEHDAHCGHDIAEIGERLAHAHQHDIGHRPQPTRLEAELAVGEPDLADDLRGGEVAVETLLRRRAERAVEGATDLGGHAERAAVGLGDVDHLEGLRAVCAQQPLACAVG